MTVGELARELGTTVEALRAFAPAELARCGADTRVSQRVAVLLSRAYPVVRKA